MSYSFNGGMVAAFTKVVKLKSLTSTKTWHNLVVVTIDIINLTGLETYHVSALYAIAHARPIHVTVFAPPSSCISIESLFFNVHYFVRLYQRIWQSQDNGKYANIMRAVDTSGSIVFHSDAQSVMFPVSRFCTRNCFSLWV